jgi:tRNA(Ile)-lysidine synthase
MAGDDGLRRHGDGGDGLLRERFEQHLNETRLFPEPGAAVLGVSGGADSVALLDLLADTAPAIGLRLVVAHADHGIQPGSGAVAESVRRLAGRYGLPFELGELRLGPGTSETAARRARYAWLRDVQQRAGARYLVTAHQSDDQTETVLLRVVRGSAPAGLAGIPERGPAGLVRPLLPFSRAELRSYARERGLSFVDDPANEDPRHLRSWVRQALVPLLRRRLGQRVEGDLRRLGRQAAAERRAWDQALELVPELQLRFGEREFTVARGVLARYDAELAGALLRAAARRVGLALGPKRARRILGLARGSSGRRLELGSRWYAAAQFDRLCVGQSDGRMVGRSVIVCGDRGSASFGAYRVTWSSDVSPERVGRTAWTTWLVGGGEWEVRPPRPGERLAPLGGVGRRPLRRLLMEARVPRSERSGYPVLARGETILWVPGICRSGVDVPRPGTRAVRVDVTVDRESQADGRAAAGADRVRGSGDPASRA